MFSRQLQNRELEYIQNVSYKNNSYPKHVIKQALQQISEEHNKATNGTDNSNNNIDENNIFSMNNESVTLEKHPLLVIPYQGKKEDHVLKSFKKGIRKMLPNNVKPRYFDLWSFLIYWNLIFSDQRENWNKTQTWYCILQWMPRRTM